MSSAHQEDPWINYWFSPSFKSQPSHVVTLLLQTHSAVCVLDIFFIPVKSPLCYRAELLLLTDERVDDVCRYLRMLIGFVDKSKWLKPAGTVGVICRCCCAESDLDVLSRRFEQHILKPEPTSRSIASKSWNDADRRSLNNVTLKRSSDRRTGPSPYSRVRTCYVQENIVVQVKLTLFTSDFTSDMNIALLVGSPVLVWPEHPSWTSRSFHCSSSRPPLLP